MSTKLYVGNLTDDITEEDLMDNFNDLGNCVSAKIIRDRLTGQSKGFAFVEMATEQEAQDVIKKCRGVELDGKKLVVSEARPEGKPKQNGKPEFRKKNKF
jgi:RNA recognition motif-containing protein